MNKEEMCAVDIELTLEQIGLLALEAHEKDITLNEYIIELLKKYTEKENLT